MTPFTVLDLMVEYSKVTGKACMFINMDSDDPDENCKAAPYLAGQTGKNIQILCDGYGVLVFETEAEMKEHYNMTVGDDGPTKANSYDGPARVYACTCVAGTLMNENT